jgi:hypothetical protein
MPRRTVILSIVNCLFILALVISAVAQQPAGAPGGEKGKGGGKGKGPATRVGLFFREEWKSDGKESQMTPANVANPSLELNFYGPSGKEMLVTGAAGNETNPVHAWTGLCTSPCGLALRDKTNFVDLSGLARIRWNTKMSGFHQVHPMIKLASGTWLVGDKADGSTVDWLETEFSLADVKWMTLDIARAVTTGNVVQNPDLTKVDEVGFVDLMPSSGHGPGGWSDVAKFEVYGKPVAR